MTGTVKLRLLREPKPPRSDGSGCRFGLQDKDGRLHDGTPRPDGIVAFDFELKVGEGDRPNFTGPFASGPPGERFVYLSWQRLIDGGVVNRIKARLADLDWAMVRAAQASGGRLEADLTGAPTGGGRRALSWKVVAD
jgi:hypothetical protein